VTTYEPYRAETSYESSLLVRPGRLATRGLLYVLRSLTSNARAIFRLIAQHQLDALETGSRSGRAPSAPSEYHGMPMQELLQQCRQQFLASSEAALRAQLTEFLDHKALTSRRGQDGSEHLSIPTERAIIEHVLQEMDDEEAV
jgi:origin recognition complex subunit 2